MEETTIEYIFSESDKIIHNYIKKIMKKPLMVQRFLYFKGDLPRHYKGTVLVEKEDRISIIKKEFYLRFGNNGLFIKQNQLKTTGVTYYKKGRSNSRIKMWGVISPFEQHKLVLKLAEKINPSCKELLEDTIIKYVSTQGMIGTIIAGKITNVTEAMIYHIKHSLRGSGININNASKLYNYYNNNKGYHILLDVLVSAKDPNAILAMFSNDINTDIKMIFKSKLNNYASDLIALYKVTGEKIDWVNSEMDPNDELQKLRKKEKWIKDVLELWDGGPILSNSSSYPVNSAVTLLF